MVIVYGCLCVVLVACFWGVACCWVWGQAIVVIICFGVDFVGLLSGLGVGMCFGGGTVLVLVFRWCLVLTSCVWGCGGILICVLVF